MTTGGAEVLFEANWRGEQVTVTHATADEVEFLSGPVGDGQDLLELWSLIAIRIGLAVEYHALGWRISVAKTHVTSRVVTVNLTLGAIRTRSGKTYRLGVRDQPDLDPALRNHLGDTLRAWGFEDVRPRVAASNADEEEA
jgi:hypothetical protein